MADLFDVVVARKLSGGGGGGGSSDFSIAEVTLNMTPPEGITVANMTVDTYVPYGISPVNDFGYNAQWLIVSDNKAEILLYHGIGYIKYVSGFNENWEYIGYSDDENATLDGDISWDSSLQAFVVTGDCTITADFIAD